MSRNLIARRAGVLAATVTAAALTTGGPALADVTVEPPSAVQGEGANVHFTVTNPGTSPITRVKLMLPADNPVAEVVPLPCSALGGLTVTSASAGPAVVRSPAAAVAARTPARRAMRFRLTTGSSDTAAGWFNAVRFSFRAYRMMGGCVTCRSAGT